MHLGAGAARPGPGLASAGPDTGVAFGEVFGDGQGVVDDHRAIMQAGHLAGRREGEELARRRVGGELVQLLGERDGQLAQQYPGPQ